MKNTFPKIVRPLLAGLLLLAGSAAVSAVSADGLVEGQHYRLLKPAQPTSTAPGKVEVVEVFWYRCGHCYVLEPKLEAWERKGKPANAVLVRLPATWNEQLKTHARVFYTTEILGRPDLHAEVFREINVRGNLMDTPEKIEAFFVSRGVSKTDFQKAFAGFSMESNIARAIDLNRRYRITSTPTVIVNGRYVTDAGMAGSEEKLFEVINALVARETPAG